MAVNLEEEASVLEIHNELLRRFDGEQSDALKHWLVTQLAAAAAEKHIGFYVDEFGAREVREIDVDEAKRLLVQGDVWSAGSDTMLHAYLLEP